MNEIERHSVTSKTIKVIAFHEKTFSWTSIAFYSCSFQIIRKETFFAVILSFETDLLLFKIYCVQ